jgi:hypothetical protein
MVSILLVPARLAVIPNADIILWDAMVLAFSYPPTSVKANKKGRGFEKTS